MILLISYDLSNADRNYGSLYKAIKSADAWWHYLDSTWMINTDDGPDVWQKRLRRHIDKDDGLLIIEVCENYQGWLPDKAWDWLERNLDD